MLLVKGIRPTAWRLRRPNWALATLAIGGLAPHLLPGFGVWLMGSALAYADSRHAGSRWSGWTMLASGLVLALLMIASRVNLLGDAAATLAVGAGFSGFAWTLLRVDPRPAALFRPFARYGAGASFSLYVLHFPALAFAAAVLFAGTRLPPSAGALFALLAGYGAALALGWLFSGVTEAQTARVRRWFSVLRR